MAAPGTAPSAARPLDPAALHHALRRQYTAAAAPWLHAEVARRMAERLAIIKQPPRVVLDWWSRLGGSREVLHAACPQARIIEVERAAAPAARAAPAWWSPQRWRAPRPQALPESDVAPASADLLWCNMGLQACADPQAVLARWQRALAAGGFLMFSTLGPGSLAGLRQLYRDRGWGAAHAPFVDMHDLGDMLVHAGFADPVMDQETLTLTWPDAGALLAELRSLGGNAAPDRFAGLRTPRWRAALEAALEAAAERPALGFEVVYGHAFKAAPRADASGRTEVPLEQMRAMVQGARRPK